MFVNGVEVISSQLDNITLDSLNPSKNMHPNAESPPACEKSRLPPLLHLTPSGAGQRRGDGTQGTGQRRGDGTQGAAGSPWLLKPHHDIPPTPPPQTDDKPAHFFPQRIG